MGDSNTTKDNSKTTEAHPDEETRRQGIRSVIERLAETCRADAPKSREAFRKSKCHSIQSMRTGFFDAEAAELLGDNFEYDEKAKHRLAGCIDALERAILEGTLIRRNLNNSQNGNVVFLNN